MLDRISYGLGLGLFGMLDRISHRLGLGLFRMLDRISYGLGAGLFGMLEWISQASQWGSPTVFECTMIQDSTLTLTVTLALTQPCS